MANAGTGTTKLTRGDKAHKKFMDKYDALKASMMHGMDSFTVTQKQTLDAATKQYEIVAKSQEAERVALYEIIKTSDDAVKIEKANERLAKLDSIAEKANKEYVKLAQEEREKADNNISGVMLCLVVAGGFISIKQFKHLQKIGGKAWNTVSKNIPRLKG